MLDEEQVSQRFEKFLHAFRNDVNKSLLEGQKSVHLSFLDLDKFDVELAEQLLQKPVDTLELMDEVLQKMDILQSGHVRFLDLPKTSNFRVRDIRSEHLGKLISVDGLIRQASEVRPEITIATFECDQCGGKTEIIQEGNTLMEPSRCMLCGKKPHFKMVEKEFEDVQKIVLEERPENMKGASQPSRISALLRNDLVDPELRDKLTPGNQVQVIGILTEVPIFTQSGKSTRRFDVMLNVNNVKTLVTEFEDLRITPEEANEIRKLAADPDIVEKIVASIAPSIYGYEEVKHGIALQLFGGVRKVREDGVTTRGDIHILLVGDPGSAKSQLLKYVAYLAPKARYVTGKGATGAGITATVVKDEFLRGWALEAGALVLASGGIGCVDELDKMSPEDRSAMHEVMEQQTVSISKANVQATLKAQASVLGAANPKYGRFDPYQPIADQIDMPDTLLSRFDLIYPIRDVPDPAKDSRLAEHILKLHRAPESIAPVLRTDILRKYIAYARKHIKPVLTEEAIAEIKSFFVGLRSKYANEENQAVPISPRQLEALVRLTESSAKLRLSNEAAVEDSKRAIDLLKYCLFKVGVDPETGRLDIDRLEGVTTASKRNKIMIVLQLLKELEIKYNGPVQKFELIEKAKERNIPPETVEQIIEDLKSKGDIYEPKSGYLQKL